MEFIKKLIHERRGKMALKDLTVSTKEHLAMLRDHNVKLLKENELLTKEVAKLKRDRRFEIERIKKKMLKAIKEGTEKALK